MVEVEFREAVSYTSPVRSLLHCDHPEEPGELLLPIVNSRDSAE
jgi:hypothetical protein